MQYHSYHYQTETHKCYGSVSQAVSTKPACGQETFTQLRRGLQRREGEEQIQGEREKEKDREDKDDLKQKRPCNLL